MVYGVLHHLVSVDFSYGFLTVVLCNIKKSQIIIVFPFQSHLEATPSSKEQKRTFALLFSCALSTYSVGLIDTECYSVRNCDKCLCPIEGETPQRTCQNLLCFTSICAHHINMNTCTCKGG